MRLFLISTHLNAIVAASVALDCNQPCHLVFIDQKKLLDIAPYVKLGLFEKVEVLYSKLTNQSKYSLRNANLNYIKSLVTDYSYTSIACGNDRRLEFQCAMYHARKSNADIKGVYLDDGIFTYLGMPDKPFDFIDTCVKKMLWGRFVKPVKQLAGSEYVDEAIVFFAELFKKRVPELAVVNEINRGQLLEILSRFDTNALMKDISLDAPALYLLFPHSSVLDEEFLAFAANLINSSNKCFTIGKKHPRDTVEAMQNILPFTVERWLEDNIPVELFYKHIKPKDAIVCGFSSVFLTLKFLYPELHITVAHNVKTKDEQLLLDYFNC